MRPTFLPLLFLSLVSCSPRPVNTNSTTASQSTQACLESGDIVVSNSGSDVVLVLNSDGSYKDVVYNVGNATETASGLAWSSSSQQVLIAIDGVDRVVAVNAQDCSDEELILNPLLTGTLRGITQLSGGDILVTETNNVERFTAQGVRIATGGWPLSLQVAASGIYAIPAGGFVHCSTTTDVVRTYNDSGVQQATHSSGIAGTTDANDCMVLADGHIAVAWSGTTDTVSIYSSDLSTDIGSYSDLNILSTPSGLAQRANGNILVIEKALHYLVEITSTGSFVQILGDGVLNSPDFILVIP